MKDDNSILDNDQRRVVTLDYGAYRKTRVAEISRFGSREAQTVVPLPLHTCLHVEMAHGISLKGINIEQ